MDRLSEIKERYQAVFERSFDLVYIHDFEGNFVDANPAALRRLGYTIEEVRTLNIASVVVPDQIPKALEHLNKIKTGGYQEELAEYKIKCKNGEFLEVETKVTIIYHKGRPAAIQGIAREITERKLAEKVILESESKYRSLVDNVKLGIFRSTIAGKHLEVNKALETITGYSRHELLSMNVSDLYWQPEDRKLLIKELISSQSGAAFEIRNKKKDGSLIMVSATITPVRDLAGNVVYLDGILEDITERKKLQVELKELYEKEKKQRQELEEESEARALFIEILGHELRTPLTPIVSSANILQDIIDAGPDEIQKQLMKNVTDGAETLACRLEELLDLVGYARGSFKLNIQPVEIKKYLQKLVFQFKPVNTKFAQRKILEIADDLNLVDLDPCRLEQVINNLLSNASKFSPENCNIWIKAYRQDNSLVIEVKDEGPGLTDDEKERLFKPYHRVEQDRNRFTGLGLGLAISQKIIEAHGGLIWIKSQIGQGSTFGFRIPLKEQTEGKPRFC